MKKLLIVRLDGIGDYLLFRNFLSIVKQSTKYCEYEITLLGNVLWKELAEVFDSNEVSCFKWIDMHRYTRCNQYKKEIDNNLKKEKFSVIVSPVYSRTLEVDNIINKIPAEKKIAFDGNYSNITVKDKNITDKFYTKLIRDYSCVKFEFDRNHVFFTKLLEDDLLLLEPTLDKKKLTYSQKADYAVLFIGAGCKEKKWAVEKYLQVAKLIYNMLNLKIVLCGDIVDKKSANIFLSMYDHPIENKVGKTSLLELTSIINNASLLVSNDTGVSHIGAILKIPTCVIFYGSHYGRFHPYPTKNIHEYTIVTHPLIEKAPEKYKKIINSPGVKCIFDINEVSVKQVTSRIMQLLGR